MHNSDQIYAKVMSGAKYPPTPKKNLISNFNSSFPLIGEVILFIGEVNDKDMI